MTQTGTGTEVSLINIFLETKDWSIVFTMFSAIAIRLTA